MSTEVRINLECNIYCEEHAVKFGGIIGSFGEFWNVKIVVFAEYAFDDFVCARDVCCIYCGSKQ